MKYHQHDCKCVSFWVSQTCAYLEISISCVWLSSGGDTYGHSADWVYLPTSQTSSHCPVTHICECERDQDSLKTPSVCHLLSSKEIVIEGTGATHDLNSCPLSAILKWKKLLETTGSQWPEWRKYSAAGLGWQEWPWFLISGFRIVTTNELFQMKM